MDVKARVCCDPSGGSAGKSVGGKSEMNAEKEIEQQCKFYAVTCSSNECLEFPHLLANDGAGAPCHWPHFETMLFYNAAF
jgi:hypothetical protein